MSPLFIGAAVVAQLMYWPSVIVGVVAGLCTPSWRRVWWVAAIATLLDFALMLLPHGAFGLKVVENSGLFFLGTIYPAAVVHVMLGSWIRQRLFRVRAPKIKAWPGRNSRR
jgi:hypothetical protein